MEPAVRRADGEALLEIFRDVTGDDGAMWGPSIVGFGEDAKTYASGAAGSWMRTGFSPRRQHLVLYVLRDAPGEDELLESLGPHKTGQSCLYVTRLARVDEATLRTLIRRSWEPGD